MIDSYTIYRYDQARFPIVRLLLKFIKYVLNKELSVQ